jgi:hypothetical protein
MDRVKTIIQLLGDLATFVWLLLRQQSALAAENLVLRKQLAVYQERTLKPRRPDAPLRVWVRHYNRSRLHSSLGPGIPDPPAILTHKHRHRVPRYCKVVAHPVPGELLIFAPEQAVAYSCPLR